MKTKQNSKVATLAKIGVLTASLALSGVAMADNLNLDRVQNVSRQVDVHTTDALVRFNLVDGQPIR